MSLSQHSLTENKSAHHDGQKIRPSAAYGRPFCRMEFWWSQMPVNVRQGFAVMIGVPLDQSEAVAQYSWALLSRQQQHNIIKQLGSSAMVAGLVRECTDEFARLFPDYFRQAFAKQAGDQS